MFDIHCTYRQNATVCSVQFAQIVESVEYIIFGFRAYCRHTHRTVQHCNVFEWNAGNWWVGGWRPGKGHPLQRDGVNAFMGVRIVCEYWLE